MSNNYCELSVMQVKWICNPMNNAQKCARDNELVVMHLHNLPTCEEDYLDAIPTAEVCLEHYTHRGICCSHTMFVVDLLEGDVTTTDYGANRMYEFINNLEEGIYTGPDIDCDEEEF